MADLKINENLYSSSDTSLPILHLLLGNVRLIGEAYSGQKPVNPANTWYYDGFRQGIICYDPSYIRESDTGHRIHINKTATYIFIWVHRAVSNVTCEGFGLNIVGLTSSMDQGNWSYPLTSWAIGTQSHTKYSCESIRLEEGTELEYKLYSENVSTVPETDFYILVAEQYDEEGLPDEYQEIEYLESSGTQYLNINIRLSVAFGFDIKFYAKSPVQTSSGYGAIFGGRNASGDHDYQLSTYGTFSGGIMRWGDATSAGSGGSMCDPGIVRNTVQTCSLHNKVFTHTNGSSEIVKSDNTAAAADCYLFGINNNGTFGQAGSGCRIYYIKFWTRENEKVRDLVPCRRKSDSVLGMYDKVDRIFFTNAGSGTFTAGPNVN